MALAETCSGKGGPKLGRFMNTTPAIADIIEIIERHGEWREHEGRTLLSQNDGFLASQKRDISKSLKWAKGREMLQYWGFSYGSVTGATFAAMQPHRVKRLIVDGICDAHSMYNGLWTTSILNSDRVMDRFFDDCYKAGPARCSFYSENGPSSMQADLDATLRMLNNTPLAVSGSNSHGPDVITYSDVMKVIKETLYDPLNLFPQLADLLADVSNGSGSHFAEFKMKKKFPVCPYPSPEDPHQIRECPPYTETSLETLVSISCTDGKDLSTASKEEFQSYYTILRQQSKWMADYWASFTLSCWGWKTRPSWRYDGRSLLPLSMLSLCFLLMELQGPITGNPQHPMLWIGNTLDPSTPLQKYVSTSQ